MNLLYIGSDAQGVRSVFEIWKSFDFGGRVMARTVRDFIPSLAKTIEKCARKPEGLHSVIKLRGSRGSNRFLGTPRIFGLVEGDGVKLGARTWKLAALAMLSGCSGLPLDGPAKQDMISGASVIASNPPYAVAMDYALVDINPIVLDCLADADTVSLSRTFGGVLQRSELVQVMCWECPFSNCRVETSLPLEEPQRDRTVGRVTSLRSPT